MGSRGDYTVVEVCAGAGGQSLGLHKAGFRHQLAVEIDETAAQTLEQNLRVPVALGDAASRRVWDPRDYVGTTLLAGGVPCPPFSVAGKQLGSSDERDLFAWTIEQVSIIRPRAIMLENVRGLSSMRFAAYRQRVLDRLDAEGYVGEWKLLYAADFGVPQLRPRFVLVAMSAEDHSHFHWPDRTTSERLTVGEALHSQMASAGWRHADEWRSLANGVGPTLVGGSKKHGGADLGPTRAKQAWAELFVDGRGVANQPPGSDAPSATELMPRLTIEMAARIQGWLPEDEWAFAGRKTSQYRQIGNAFPPPVAEAVGASIVSALGHKAARRSDLPGTVGLQDPVYKALASSTRPLSLGELLTAQQEDSLAAVERKLAAIKHDFELDVSQDEDGTMRYKLGAFKGFTGQHDHSRHAFVAENRHRVS
ncbi:DNA cytosine methyltransferase [Microbacterium sp. SSM24]|uniref:DNA cytosine methyltransferase n=1 Tax=Microbacterium sp. SSM24 TaxID=2991714 RepID=UPI00222808B2|nr:DNA cytosine methyltransferase [Microbacterium sp. SSM24]MCW3493893.1 DNA cytosine methyltransferase [Microbacterium sp. SSM24]